MSRRRAAGNGSDDDSSDLQTAHSAVDVADTMSARDGEGGVAAGDVVDDEGDLEMKIQQLFGMTLDDDMRDQFTTDMMLDALEAQIDAVIRTIGDGSTGTASTAVDRAIVERFRAKNVAVEKATCEASELPPLPGYRRASVPPPTPAIPLPIKSPAAEAAVNAFSVAVALCLLAVVLVGFSRAGMIVCGISCECTLGESIAFAGSFFLAQQAPRCLLFAFAADRLVRSLRAGRGGAAAAAAEDGDGHHANANHHDDVLGGASATLIRAVRRKRPWILALGSLVVTVLVEWLVATLKPEPWFLLPGRALEVALPTFAFCAAYSALAAAVPLVWLQVMPIIFQILVPSFVDLPVAVVVIWPVVVPIFEQIFFYALFMTMPSVADAQLRTASVYVASFYSRAVIVTTALSLDMDRVNNAGGLLALYCVLHGLVEFVLSTHWIDQGLLAMANALRHCGDGDENDSAVTAATAAAGSYTFGGHDLRLMAAYVRHVAAAYALAVCVPLLAVRSWPVAVKACPDCNGEPRTGNGWWIIWGALAGTLAVSWGCTLLRRWRAKAVMRPLLIGCPVWALLVAMYLALSAPEALAYVSKE